MTEEITKHLIGLGLGLLFAFGATALFYAKGFYKKTLAGYKHHVTLMTTLGAFFIYFAMQLLLIPFLVGVWFIQQKQGIVLTEFEAGWINLGIIYVTALVVIAFALFISSAIREAVWNPKQVSSRAARRSFLLGALTWVQAFPFVIVIGQLMTLFLLVVVGVSPPDQDQEMIRFLKKFQNQPFILYPLAVAVAFVVPVMEEILFRGFLQNLFTKYFGKIIAIVFTSLFFAALHFTPDQGTSNFLFLPALFVLSCFLGYLYERQGTLAAPIGLHMAFNSLTLLFLLASFHFV